MLNKRLILISSFTLVIALILLCILGAFLGSEPTAKAFSSMPFAIFWIMLIGITLMGIFSFRNLFTRPAMFAMHLGFVMVLLGSMFQTEHFGRVFGFNNVAKISNGKMILFEGQACNTIRVDPYGISSQLPFDIRLVDFRAEYYPKQNPTEPNVVKNYFSDIEIIEDSNVVRSSTVRVNKPLHYAGYHIYQYGLDENLGRFAVFEVVSDSGLLVVYAGFVLVCVGMFWHFWYERLIKRRY